ncbi:MAG: glycosyltransferase family 4 protein [Firmicutes bacterium]|nr:glycosyltransferase family 4 protein [Bacillota bacterium]
MKVLMIVTSPELGGTETHVLYLARELMRRGVQVGVATAGGPFAPYFADANLAVHAVSCLEKDRMEKSASKIETLVQAYGYDIVHVHDSESLALLPLLKQRMPTLGLVMTVHGKYVSASAVKRSHAVADRILAVSPALLNWVHEIGAAPGKALWVPNGIDTETFSPVARSKPFRRAIHVPESGLVGLYVGRFQSDKIAIAQTCIEAAERVAKRRLAFTMLLIGFGDYRRRLQRKARQANERLRREAIIVREATLNIAPFYQASSFVIGTGRVALEAMACAKPVIATGYAGYDGIVTESELPRLLAGNFGDHGAKAHLHASRLATDMQTLLHSPIYRRSLGAIGRRVVVEQFSIERSATLTLAAYREVVTQKSDLLVRQEKEGGEDGD